MALIARDANHRAEQVLAIMEQMIPLIEAETAAIRAGQDPPESVEEKNRLANVYRQEIARIARDPSLLAGLDPRWKGKLTAATVRLQQALGAHEISLAAARELTEGLVRALAEEITRQREGLRYGQPGAPRAAGPAAPIALDRSA